MTLNTFKTLEEDRPSSRTVISISTNEITARGGRVQACVSKDRSIHHTCVRSSDVENDDAGIPKSHCRVSSSEVGRGNIIVVPAMEIDDLTFF